MNQSKDINNHATRAVNAAIETNGLEILQQSQVKLAIYADELSFASLHGDADKQFDYAYHCDYIRACQRVFQEHGIKAVLVEVALGECLEWLKREGLENTSQNRAEFVAKKAN